MNDRVKAVVSENTMDLVEVSIISALQVLSLK